MKEKEILYFIVHKLNNERTIKVSFDDNKKIIVSDNGYGKTSVINLLYGLLTQSKHVLNYDFFSLELKTNQHENIILTREIIKLAFSRYNVLDNVFSDLQFIFDEESKNLNQALKIIESKPFLFSILLYSLTMSPSTKKLQEIISNHKSLKTNQADNYIKAIRGAIMKYDSSSLFIDDIIVDFDSLLREIESLPEQKNANNYIFEIKNSVESLLDFCQQESFIHFPTYRIIEKNIRELVKEDDIDENDYISGVNDVNEFFSENNTIQFGVENIQNQWIKITESLRAKTTENYLTSSGKLLFDTISKKEISPERVSFIKENLKIINKVLARLPESVMPNDNKALIFKNLKNISFLNENKNIALLSLLEYMILIDSDLKSINKIIEQYCKSINKFLFKKQGNNTSFSSKSIFFDEMTSTFKILNRLGNEISVDKLSYGEKQIIMIFTRIHLMDFETGDTKYWIFMDEPEISLSFEWQSMLLPEIISSKKCKFLFSSTHSPFIFKNDLKKYTTDLSLESWEIEK